MSTINAASRPIYGLWRDSEWSTARALPSGVISARHLEPEQLSFSYITPGPQTFTPGQLRE